MLRQRMNSISLQISTPPRGIAICLTSGIVVAVGLIDYATGYELSFSVFYLIAIVTSFWLVGRTQAVLISILSIASWILGDWAAGMRYSSSFILAWNAVITMTFYMIVLALLARIKSSQDTLEMRIKERTAALRDEMAENRRLEKEILRISESERQRIGYDLHDNLCQHLTGTAIAALNVEQDLADMGNEKAAGDVRRLVDLVEDGISLAREIARGLSPLHLESEGLMDCFEELAMTTRNRLKTDCRFECDLTLRVEDAATAIHLYRIAQEAVSNAVRHGKAKHIIIRFSEAGDQVELTIRDDGVGLTPGPLEGRGMGLLIMKRRAAMIDADFSVDSVPAGGTAVTCAFKKSCPPTRSEHDS